MRRMSLATKRALATTLKQLMRGSPLREISVQMIAEQTGISRHSFYYHFIDKQDLVQWVFHSEVLDVVGREEGGFLTQLSLIMSRMQMERNFYMRALEESGQNSFSDYLLETVSQLCTKALTADLPTEVVVDEKKIAQATRLGGLAIFGTLCDWVRDGLEAPPNEVLEPFEQMAGGLFSLVQSWLLQAD